MYSNFFYKIFLKFFILLLLLCGIDCGVILQDISEPTSYKQTPWGVGISYTKCNTAFYLYVSNTDYPIYQIQVISGKNALIFTDAESSDQKSAIYGVVVSNFDYGVYNTSVAVTINSIDYNYTFYYSCIEVNFSSIQIEIIEPLSYDFTTNYFLAMVKIHGLNYTIPYIDTTSINVVNQFSGDIYSFYFISVPYYFLEDWEIEITFNKSSKVLLFPSPFNPNINNSIGLVKRYPDEGIIPHYFGMSSVSVISFLSTIKTQHIPYFQLFFQHVALFYNYIPVYGTLGNYTYLASMKPTYFQYDEKDIQNGFISLYTQEFDRFAYIYNSSLDFYYMYLNSTISGSQSYSQNITNLLLKVNPTIKYLSHTPIAIETDYGSMIVDWPYGYGKGNRKQFDMDISISRVLSRPISYLQFTIESNQIYFSNINAVNSNSNDINPPELISFNASIIYDQMILIQMRVTDDLSGVSSIYLFSTDYKYYGNLVSGNKMDGTYEMYFEKSKLGFLDVSFSIQDNNGNVLFLREGYYYGPDPNDKIQLPTSEQEYSVDDIEDISFLYNYIDTSGRTFFNKIFIKFKNDSIKTGSIAVIFSFSYSLTYQSKSNLIYNSTLKLWEGSFSIPANLQYSTVVYNILSYRSQMDVVYISSSSFKDEYQLKVYSNNTDLYGPVFNSINKILPFQNQTTGQYQFGWNFTIYDHLNGFKEGIITVRGDLDNSIYNFTLTPDQMIEGDIWTGQYQILLSVNSTLCANMNYTITYVLLVDNYLFQNVFEQTNVNSYLVSRPLYPQLNPFLYYLQDAYINTLYLFCGNNKYTSTYPSLVSFNVSTKHIDVGVQNSQLVFEFEIYDLNGLKEDQNPMVYLQSTELDFIKAESSLIGQSNYTNFKFNGSVVLPIGFSYPNNIMISIYGIINRVGNFIGYSSSSLARLGFPYNVSTSISFPEDQVVLYDARYTNGVLWIRGRGLNYVQHIEISGIEFSFLPVIDENIKSTFKILNYEPLSNETNSKISITAITSLSTRSNSLNDIPIVNPIYVSPITIENPGQLCQGSPSLICGGEERGYCDESVGCICYSPFMGLDCSSTQITDLNKPAPNPLEPSFILEYNQTQNDSGLATFIQSNITIIEIRELNILGQVEKIHKFENWDFSINPNTSELIYKTNLTNNDFDTFIQVTLKWFDQQEQIQFGNDKYQIDPSTMKFSMRMSEYKFSNELNILELILYSSIISINDENSVKCSSVQFGNTTTDDCNFVKLQVDNHSLYAKLIRKSIVDNHIVQVVNQGLNITTGDNNASSLISIQIPHYLDYLIIDPTFSILLDYQVVNEGGCHSNFIPPVISKSVALIVGLVIGIITLTSFLLLFLIKLIFTNPYFINIKIMILHIKFIILYFKVKK